MGEEQKEIELYDIDGTLTYAFGDIQDKTGFETYAFWPLISYHFTKDADDLRKQAAEWDESMKHEVDPTGSSHKMMQVGIDTFRGGVTSEDVRRRGKEVTLRFIEHGVIRSEAMKYLIESIKEGVTCVLSTGSYKDGALGFVDALVEGNILEEEDASKLLVSGAVVDWGRRKLQHANVLERKIIGLENELGKKLDEFQPKITAVFADDPYVNDRDLVKLAPEGKSYIITTTKNQDKPIPENCVRASWEEIYAARHSVICSHI